MSCDLARPFNASDSTERLAQDFGFVCELRFVGDVLVIAAAANAKMRASRGRAVRRRFEQALQARANEFLFLLDRRGGDALRRKHKGHEHGRAIMMRQALAAIN